MGCIIGMSCVIMSYFLLGLDGWIYILAIRMLVYQSQIAMHSKVLEFVGSLVCINSTLGQIAVSESYFVIEVR